MNRRQDVPSGRLRLLGALVGLVAAVAAAAGIAVRASHGGQTTGDEPHYLLTAISLGEDRDLDLSDEFAAERYREFHEALLAPQGKPDRRGRVVSPHEPLLPALLAAPTAAAGWVGAKLGLALVAGSLAALMLWTAVRRLSVPLWTATTAVVVFGASAPIAVYGSQLYPELPAALAVTVGMAALTGPLHRGGLVALASAVVALPFLGTKFVPVGASLALVAAIRLIRNHQRRVVVGFVVALAVGAAGYLGAHLVWYGGWTPYAAGTHFAAGGEISVVGYDPDFLGRSSRLIGLLIDRTFGLAPWQPAWLLGLPALAAILNRRPDGWEAIVPPLLVSWLTAAFLAPTMHGWWWPGRHVVAALPAAVLVVAWWAGNSGWRVRLLAGVGALGIATYGWVIAEGLGKGLTWAVDFFTTSNPGYRLWRLAFPDYTNPGPRTWVLHGIWVLAAALSIGWVWQRQSRRRGASRAPEVGTGKTAATW